MDMRMSKRGHIIRHIICLVMMIESCLAVAGPYRAVLDLDRNRQPILMEDWGDAWLDSTGRAQPDMVATDQKLTWAPTNKSAVYRVGTGEALWLRFTVPPAPDAERWYLEIPVPTIDRATLYTPDSVGKWSPQSAGDSIPIGEWPVPHRHPLLALTVSAEQPNHYLLRVENAASFSMPLRFVSEAYLSQREQRASLLLGIYFGVAASAALLALQRAFSLRDGAYAGGSLAVSLVGLSQAEAEGLAALHIWPHSPWWNDVASSVLPVLATAATIWCGMAIISMWERSRMVHRLMTALCVLGVPVSAALIMLAADYRQVVVLSYILVTGTVGLAAFLWAMRRIDRYGPWLLLSSILMVAGWLVHAAHIAGWLSTSFWTAHAVQTGTALQWPVLLIVIVLSSQHRRETNRRIQGLDRIDPATGLINGREFGERLRRMVGRSQRMKYRSALVLVEIVNIDQLRREFGRRTADEIPLRVAGRLLSIVRDVDSVARISPYRFGLLVEGPLSPMKIAAIGPRVVARCLMPFRNRPIGCIPRVRVVQTLVPLGLSSPVSVIDQLEELLAAVPPHSKRSVFTLRPGEPGPAWLSSY
jgi:two-component system, sensor histidine kinase LadS